MSGNGARCANHQVYRHLGKGHDPNSVFALSVVLSVVVLSVFAVSVCALFALSIFAPNGNGATSTSY